MILYINNLFDNHVSWKTHFKNSLSFPYIPKGSNFLEAYLMSDCFIYLFFIFVAGDVNALRNDVR